MALHLVGETLDKTRSYYMAGTGKLVQLMRGIYVEIEAIAHSLSSTAVYKAGYSRRG